MSQRGALHNNLNGINDYQILQFATRLVSTNGNDPERMLAAAVLLQAIREFYIGRYITKYGNGNSRRVAHAEAAEWFASLDESWCFSFRNICTFLDLDPLRIHDLILGASTCQQPTLVG